MTAKTGKSNGKGRSKGKSFNAEDAEES